MRSVGLIYHDVVPRAERVSSGFQGPGPDSYKLEPEAFARHLDAIAGAVGSPARVTAEAGTAHRLFLTFDDGGASAAGRIAPELARRGWPGHFFLVTGRLGTPGFLAPEMVRELHAAGHVIGSHSHSHAILTRLTPTEVDTEWRRSKEELEQLLGAEVDALSVPRGYVTRAILETAAACGYRHLFTSEPWLEPRRVGEALAYGRLSVTEATPISRVAAFARLSRTAVLREATLWYARKAAKAAAGPAYDQLRARLLSRR